MTERRFAKELFNAIKRGRIIKQKGQANGIGLT
jgi:hypothetical protein